jgi:hypothetical protein
MTWWKTLKNNDFPYFHLQTKFMLIVPEQTPHCWMQLRGCHLRNRVHIRSLLEMKKQEMQSPKPQEPGDHIERINFRPSEISAKPACKNREASLVFSP